ncbi:MAG TPA: hydantoinase/oxoprolinase family protein [Steroidobacteraceae bacterium]|nr:hydantoinase/oxoprolinase family protein [Steroidobacteraceae bacterium]
MRVGVDVGGTNTDAVLMEGNEVVAWTKNPTSPDVSGGVAAAIDAVISKGGIRHEAISAVMVGTTHFTNALVERRGLDRVGILRLASPSGEALPPLTAWPAELCATVGDSVYLLPGGYEVDGREIAPLDESRVRAAARELRSRGIAAVAVTSVFAPLNAAMETRAAAIIKEEHPEAAITVSNAIGRVGLIERENASILNAALTSLATRIVSSFESALHGLGITAPLYITQNDGTLISAARAAAYPATTIGSGPTNSMRGAAFLTGCKDAIVMDVGGTTTDIGVLANGFPRESSIAVDIGGVRTNFRMPDVLALGFGGGTRIHLDASLHRAGGLDENSLRIGPDSVGYRITEEAMIFGGHVLTASDVAVAAGRVHFGSGRPPDFSPAVLAGILSQFRRLLEEGIDRMKTSREPARILAVGGGSFLIPDSLTGVAEVIRAPHAHVANAVGAAIAQVGGQVEQVVNYESVPRSATLERLKAEACSRVTAAGGDPDTVEVVDVEEVFLSYLPGRTAQVRIRAVGDLGRQLAGAHAHDGATVGAANGH